jgi:non-ribosomal peptide synthase protein (TIGR01720 family)
LLRAAASVQRSLDLGRGPLFRVVQFACRGGEHDRLLIVAHHLVMDGVSWRVLLEDLLAAYSGLEKSGRFELLPKTTAFKQWAERLSTYAGSEALLREMDFWRGVVETDFHPLPLDHVEGRNDVASADAVVVSLSEDETRSLLSETPSAYRTQINDVLLTALVLSMARWTGRRSLLLHLEGHGREQLFEDVDLSRTVGWFTSLYPVKLDLEASLDGGEALKSVKEQLRNIPRRGIGYGVLRYLRPDTASALESVSPEVSFNYLGRFDQLLPEYAPVALASESTGPLAGESTSRAHLLDINGVVVQGRLQLAWTYSRNRHHRATIEELASRFLRALKDLMEHCRQPDAGGSTPSDFPLARLDQAQVDRLVGSNRSIEDVYPLYSLQSGLLFHSIYTPESRMYFEQFVGLLHGKLHIEPFRRAWQRVVKQHPILRTGFVSEGLPEPLQIVQREAELEFRILDWRQATEAEQARRFTELLEADQERGLDLEHPPLMRLAWVRVGDEDWRFVWSHHHVILDGWSLPLLLRDVMIFYEGFRLGHDIALPAPRPYRDFIEWLGAQDWREAEAYWRGNLRGFRSPTPLRIGARASVPLDDKDSYGEAHLDLSAEETAALEGMARSRKLAVNALFQGAWALLLSVYSGERDIVYGTTVSGRSALLPGVDSMLGLFINMLPFRVQVEPGMPLLDWLHRLQAEHAELRQYEHTPLDRVQRWSDIEGGRALFESTLAFENYPLDLTSPGGATSLELRELRHLVGTNYPLVLMVVPRPHLSIRVRFRRSRFDDEAVRRILGHFELALDMMRLEPDSDLAAFLNRIENAARSEDKSERTEREKTRIERLKKVRPTPVRLPGEGASDT